MSGRLPIKPSYTLSEIAAWMEIPEPESIYGHRKALRALRRMGAEIRSRRGSQTMVHLSVLRRTDAWQSYEDAIAIRAMAG